VARPPRILIVRGGAIGDFIMTLPAIAALRAQWPAAEIEILGYPHIAELGRGEKYADAVRSIEAKAMAGFFVPNGQLDADLKNYFGSFNLVVSYLFDPDSLFADNVRRCGVKQVIEASPRPTEVHAAEHYCKPLEKLAIFVSSPRSKIVIRDDERSAAIRFLQEVGAGTRVVLHPGSGSEKKNWSVEKFAALARWISDELAAEVLLVEGEADKLPVAQVLKLISPRPARVLSGLKLRELAAVLEQCSLFVGNDSGITHLAAAVGMPTVALFGPSSLPIWEPRGEQVAVVKFGANDVAEVRRVVTSFLASAKLQ
jgi:heptosyltransferase III